MVAGTSDEVLDHSSNSPAAGGSAEDPAGRKTPSLLPSNSSVHVCWHRATSVHYSDYVSASQNQLSGYLLRKFKNSMGWQKLWVVFTNFCLFFYKTFQDDAPLASLPLLGYTVSSPAPHDMVTKEHVIKLQFKNHVYFFRAESEYTFSRWLEVIGGATQASVNTKAGSPAAGQQTVQL
ncbi:Pleckstrin domain [Trinorchestia longiramus]|nr:Pleckstrin domain [Trinorchestia longiramus]